MECFQAFFLLCLEFWHSAIFSHYTTEISLMTSSSLNGGVFLYLHWSLSLTFVTSLPTFFFHSTLALLGFHNSIFASPFWQLRCLFPFPFAMEISAGFYSSAFPGVSVPSHTGTSDVCIHLGLSIHPVLHFSHCVFLGKCLCQFNFHMAAAELPRSPLKC